jgi:hypothetical protein
MNIESIDPIVRALLYEGYLLYPYRSSALKNKQRWNFGAIYPSEGENNDQSLMRTECIVSGDSIALIEIKVRFLQLISRQVEKLNDPSAGPDGYSEVVEVLETADQVYRTWEEAAEREICLQPAKLSDLVEKPAIIQLHLKSETHKQPIHDPSQNMIGMVLRSQAGLDAALEVSAYCLEPGIFKIRTEIQNKTNISAGSADQEKIRRTLLSTHTILHVVNGEFVSLLDPPEEMRSFAEQCENRRTWPVLAGNSPRRDLLLSSPIILYDYPQIAPESAGDLFDGTEIDEILLLRIMTMTDEEKRQMKGLDERAQLILDRTEAISNDHFMQLHGAQRKPPGNKSVERSIQISGVECRAGDRVRLCPLKNADIFDLALKGRTARIQSIEHDFDGKFHLAVVLDDDPGRDLGEQKFPGHRFFFTPDELEPVTDAS